MMNLFEEIEEKVDTLADLLPKCWLCGDYRLASDTCNNTEFHYLPFETEEEVKERLDRVVL